MIKIYTDGSRIVDTKVWKFPGGEVGINVGVLPTHCDGVVIKTLIKSSDDIMTLVMAVDAINRNTETKNLKLMMSYVPYARQDRVCNKGESLSIATFAKIINSLNFDEVIVDDTHSPQTLKYINHCIEVPQHELMWRHNEVRKFIEMKNVMLVALDEKADIKTRSHIARHPNLQLYVIQLAKLKDTTGEVKRLEMRNQHMVTRLHNTNLLIVDDICDEGRVFIEAAKLLREVAEPLSISLFVTHGIFSKGKEILYEAGINNIWCYNDFTVL